MIAKILREQKDLKVVRDSKIVKWISENYRFESKHGRGGQIKEKGDQKRRNLYMSDVHRCPREIYFMFHSPEVARDYTIKGLMLFADGNYHHQDIQRRLEERKRGRNPEGFLEDPETGATGYYDELIPVGEENGWQICDLLEIKSKNSPAMTKVAQGDYDQGQYYLLAAGWSRRLKTLGIKIRNLRVLYKDRSLMLDEPLVGWTAAPDPERQKAIREHFMWMKETIIEKGKIVDQPYARDYYMCQFCRYHHWCWKGFPDPKSVEAAPEILTDERPEQEILLSLSTRFLDLKAESAALKKEEEGIKKVFMNYFAHTKTKTFPISEDKNVGLVKSVKEVLDNEYLLKRLGATKYSKISEPVTKLIAKGIEEGYISAKAIQRAKSPKVEFSIRILKKKEEVKKEETESER